MNAAGFLGVFLRLFRKFVFVRDDLDVTSDLGLKLLLTALRDPLRDRSAQGAQAELLSQFHMTSLHFSPRPFGTHHLPEIGLSSLLCVSTESLKYDRFDAWLNISTESQSSAEQALAHIPDLCFHHHPILTLLYNFVMHPFQMRPEVRFPLKWSTLTSCNC